MYTSLLILVLRASNGYSMDLVPAEADMESIANIYLGILKSSPLASTCPCSMGFVDFSGVF